MKEEYLLNATQVAVVVGVSVPTLNMWYKWRTLNPEHELAKKLPDYAVLEHGRRTRYWKQEDMWRLVEFKMSIPQGRNGLMGEVTQRYVKKGKNHEKSEEENQ